jgi:hypothetical protein
MSFKRKVMLAPLDSNQAIFFCLKAQKSDFDFVCGSLQEAEG